MGGGRMTERKMIVVVEVDDDVAQGDEFEGLMAEVENVVVQYIDPAFKRVKVIEVPL